MAEIYQIDKKGNPRPDWSIILEGESNCARCRLEPRMGLCLYCEHCLYWWSQGISDDTKRSNELDRPLSQQEPQFL